MKYRMLRIRGACEIKVVPMMRIDVGQLDICLIGLFFVGLFLGVDSDKPRWRVSNKAVTIVGNWFADNEFSLNRQIPPRSAS
jgi:hypothetical protein